jgi:hypothetical protein
VTDGLQYKIGKATNVDRRVRGIQTGNPRKVRLLHQAWCRDNHSAEKQLHDLFDEHRGNGEWFKLSSDQVNECIELMERLSHV